MRAREGQLQRALTDRVKMTLHMCVAQLSTDTKFQRPICHSRIETFLHSFTTCLPEVRGVKGSLPTQHFAGAELSRIVGSSAGKACQRDGTACTKARRTRKNCMFYCLSRINLFSTAEGYLSTRTVIGYSQSTAFTAYPSGPESQQDQPVGPWQSPPLALRFSSGMPALSPRPQPPSVMCPYPRDPHPPRLPFCHSSPSKCCNFCPFA